MILNMWYSKNKTQNFNLPLCRLAEPCFPRGKIFMYCILPGRGLKGRATSEWHYPAHALHCVVTWLGTTTHESTTTRGWRITWEKVPDDFHSRWQRPCVHTQELHTISVQFWRGVDFCPSVVMMWICEPASALAPDLLWKGPTAEQAKASSTAAVGWRCSYIKAEQRCNRATSYFKNFNEPFKINSLQGNLTTPLLQLSVLF